MSEKRIKFGIGIGIILALVAWLAVSGFQQNKTYYFTVSELLGGKGGHEHVRVGGVVAQGSVERHGGQVTFRLVQDSASIPVTYVGSDTLPDTFVGGAQAIIEGNFDSSGVFQADKVQAKCASKYQAAPPGTSRKVAQNGSYSFFTKRVRMIRVRPINVLLTLRESQAMDGH
jgi:cytochrome c-type biogenesis protein CcmE